MEPQCRSDAGVVLFRKHDDHASARAVDPSRSRDTALHSDDRHATAWSVFVGSDRPGASGITRLHDAVGDVWWPGGS